MPGSNARPTENAHSLPVDCIVPDGATDVAPRGTGGGMGANGLAKDTRPRLVPGRAPMLPWLMTCVAAARANGIDIIDGVYNDIADTDGFTKECQQGRDLGFDG